MSTSTVRRSPPRRRTIPSQQQPATDTTNNEEEKKLRLRAMIRKKLVHNSEVLILDREGCVIEECVVDVLVDELKRHNAIPRTPNSTRNRIQTLSLGGSRMGTHGYISLVRSKSVTTSLKRLLLSDSDVHDDDVAILAPAFLGSSSSCCCLKSWNLSENCITSQGCIELVKHLKDNTSLEQLGLWNNHIQVDGIQSLLTLLEEGHNTTLIYVDVFGNQGICNPSTTTNGKFLQQQIHFYTTLNRIGRSHLLQLSKNYDRTTRETYFEELIHYSSQVKKESPAYFVSSIFYGLKLRPDLLLLLDTPVTTMTNHLVIAEPTKKKNSYSMMSRSSSDATSTTTTNEEEDDNNPDSSTNKRVKITFRTKLQQKLLRIHY